MVELILHWRSIASCGYRAERELDQPAASWWSLSAAQETHQRGSRMYWLLFTLFKLKKGTREFKYLKSQNFFLIIHSGQHACGRAHVQEPNQGKHYSPTITTTTQRHQRVSQRLQVHQVVSVMKMTCYKGYRTMFRFRVCPMFTL